MSPDASPSVGLNRSHPVPSIWRYLLSGGAWVVSGRTSSAIAVITGNAIVARLLSSSEVGAYFLILSMVSLASVVSQLGLPMAMVQTLATAIGLGQPQRARALVSKVFLWGTMGALVMGAIVLALGPYLAMRVFRSSLIEEVIDLVALMVVLSALQQLLVETFRGFSDLRYAAIFSGAASNVFSAVLFAMLWWREGHSDLRQVLIVSTVAGFSSVALASLLLRSKWRSLGKGSSPVATSELLRIAIPVLVTNLALMAFGQTDLLILGAFRSQQEVAIFATAAKTASLVAIPSLMANGVVSPMVAEFYSQRRTAELEQVLRATATLAALPALMLLAAFIIFPSTLLGWVYGNFYQAGAGVLVVLSVGDCINVLAGSCGIVLIMTGHQKTLMAITIMTGAVTTLLSLLVASLYGARGVALASAAGLITQNVAMWWASRLRTGMWTHAGLQGLRTLLRQYQEFSKNEAPLSI